jgi:hypothetical protein
MAARRGSSAGSGTGDPSRARRLAFACALAGLTWLAIEIGSGLLLWWVDGRWPSPERLQEERRAALGALRDEGDPAEAGALPAMVENAVLHPFAGYVIGPPPGARRPAPERNPRLNAFGYLDPSGPLHSRSPGKLIVAIVGGSVAQHFGDLGADVLAERLRASRRFAGRDVVFVRLALLGYRQPQQLATITYLLALGAEFDLVINLDGYNEVVQARADHKALAYPSRWYFLASRLPARLPAEYQYLRVARDRIAELHSRPLLRRSLFANLLWRLRDRSAQGALEELHQAILAQGGLSSSRVATGPIRHYADYGEMLDDLVAIWKQSSLQLARLCRANGIEYFHFLQPNQYVPDSKPMEAEELRVATDPRPSSRLALPGRVGYPRLIAAGAELRSQGVRFADLTRVFADRPEPLYYDRCCHFGRAGHALLAEAMARAILAPDPRS